MRVLQNTEFDQIVDENSINPGEQMFEKRVSGMFLGEILRRVLLRLMSTANLFNGQTSHILEKHNGIDTSPMSKIAADNSPELTRVAEVIRDQLHIRTSTVRDRQAVKTVS